MNVNEALSVGELLAEAGRQSRDLLWDARDLPPHELLAGIDPVLRAAARLIDALQLAHPTRPQLPTRPQRFAPGGNEPAAVAVSIAHLLDWSADLIVAAGREPLADIEGRLAVQARALHCCRNTVHAAIVATTVAGRAHERRRLVALSSVEAQLTTADMRDVLRRVRGDYLTDDHGRRLEDALSCWRAARDETLLNTDPVSAPVMQVLAHTEAALATHAQAIIRVAGERGVLTTATAVDLLGSFRALAQAWAALPTQWPRITTVGAAHSLLPAAAELRASLDAITRDGPGWGSGETIVNRLDLAPALTHLHLHIDAGATAAHGVETALTALTLNPTITAWSQPLARAAMAAGASSSQLVQDAYVNRLIPIRREHLSSAYAAAGALAAAHDRLAARFEGVPFDGRTAGLVPNSAQLARLVQRLRTPTLHPTHDREPRQAGPGRGPDR